MTGTALPDTRNDTGTFASTMPEDVPLQRVEVLWRQDGDVVVLGSVGVEPDGSFELYVTVRPPPLPALLT